MDNKNMNYYALVRFAATQHMFVIPYENNFLEVGDEVVDQEGRIGKIVGLCSDLEDGETANMVRALNWDKPLPRLKSKISEHELHYREESDNG